MNNIFYILERDIKRILKNWVAILVVLGICLLPSLYAWFNVAANMDPYEHTSDMRVAVASEDKGVSDKIAGDVNAGDKIEDALRDQSLLGWVFTDREDAIKRVRSGDCYAAYIIPEDFSENLLSFTHGRTVTPEIEYYVNEKLNPIAPKVTDTAASVFRITINDMFKEIVAGKILGTVNDTTKEIHKDVTIGQTNLTSDIEASRQLLREYRQTINGFSSVYATSTKTINSTRKLAGSIDSNLRAINKSLNSNDALLDDLETDINDTEALVNEHRAELGEILSAKIIKKLDAMNAGIHSAQGLSAKGHGLVYMLQPETALMRDMLTDMQSGLDATKRSLNNAKASIDATDSLLLDAERSLGSLESIGAFEQIESLSGKNSKAFSQYLVSPVTIKTEKQFPVENYGSGLAPFYTMLAIWVSGLILIAIFRLEVDPESDDGRKFTMKQKYFGRSLLLTILGLIQTTVICGGNIWLLGIQCLHPVAFFGAALLASVVFVNLIYALAVTFRHVGKALAVIIIILQIPGSSGTYPIETTGAFFQTLKPFLPFTYGISALREAIAGFYGAAFWISLARLLLFLGVALFIGLGLRALLSNLNSTFDRRLQATGFLAADTGASTGEITTLKKAVKLLYSNRESRYMLEEYTERFEQKHAWLEEKGLYFVFLPTAVLFILICILPWKLLMLCLWILTIIATVVFLVIMEHTHMIIQDRKYLKEVSANEKHTGNI
ncbi:MAG: YhgE/Pip domain-containing protein [Clostridia bacterium]|nr:YhgE/Pip domain-containing protein [Clostridia bacterium]